MATTRTTRSSSRATTQNGLPAASDTTSRPAAATGTRRKRKFQAAYEEEEDVVAPATPAKRTLRVKKKSFLEPDVPTPIALIAEPIPGVPATPKPKPRAVSRLAEPNATHATIVSPETFRVIEPSQVDEEASPSKAAAAGDDILETACRHLIKVDPRMKRLIDKHHCRIFSTEGLAEKIDPFESLVSSMISQLVSGASARTIKARFIRLFADPESPSDAPPFPRPSQVAEAAIPDIQSAGVARRKAEWIKGLAERFVSGELSAKMMAEAPYDELHKTLLALPGLGVWSVEMFACFALKRLDVFSVGDLGVQRGMAAFEGRNVSKLRSAGGKWKYMSKKDMEEISAKFAPYRSVFMWYMWRVEETDISTLE